MADKLYGVLFPVQKKQIEAWCWDSCGHGLAGAVDLGEGMPHAVPCNESDCPHLDKEMDEPLGETQGRPLFLRKLKEVDSA